MSADNAIIPLDGSGPVEYHPDEEPGPRQASPIRRALMIMRGRWFWAVGLAVLLGAIGGALGYMVPEPVYRSRGLIGIQPVLPHVIYETDQNQPLPMVEAFIDRQVRRVGQQRVLRQAMQRDEWQELGERRGPAADFAGFARRLGVNSPRNSQVITVSFSHTDPEVAQTAVRLVIEAYEQIYQENSAEETSERLTALRDRRRNLRSELDRVRNRRLEMASEYGTDDLRQVYQVKLEEMNRLGAELDRLRFRLVKRGSSAEEALNEGDGSQGGGNANAQTGSDGGNAGGSGSSGNAARPLDPSEMTVQQIAARDQRMQQYLRQRESLERELRRQRLTLGNRHRLVEQTRAMLDSIDSSIQERARRFRESYSSVLSGRRSGSTGELTVEQLEQRYRDFHRLYEQARQEARQLGNQRLELEGLKREESGIRSRLSRTEQRIEELEVEGEYIRQRTSGRISVLSYGNEPLSPARDRRKVAGFAGVTFGGGAGMALVLLVGFLDRRVRNLEEAEDTLQRVALLGLLPRLPADPTDPEQAETTAHAVHKIRTLLQIGPDAEHGRVFSVTSPTARDGKTSLTLALGMSFATSGARTLLIDCDLVQAGLSHRVCTDRSIRICQAVRREKLVDDERLQDAVARANAEDRDLEEVLTQTGAMTREALRSATPERSLGLLDALESGALDFCAVPSGIPGLWIVPSGTRGEGESSRLSPSALRRLFAAAREAFEVILVDTGPVPGSIEATQVAANADGVVVVIARGGTRVHVEQAVEHLRSLGAHLSGVVFNRAEERDLRRMSDTSLALSRVEGRTGRSGDGQTNGGAGGATAIARTVAGSSLGNGNGNSNGKGNGLN